MPRSNRVRRKRCDCFGRDGERPHVCSMCGRKFVYCTSFKKHVKAHHDGGLNDDCGTVRPANSSPIAPRSSDARNDVAVFLRGAADGPDASVDTPTSTTTPDRADGPRSHAVVGPRGADVHFRADRRNASASDVIVISSDSSDGGDSDADGAPDTRGGAPDTRDGAPDTCDRAPDDGGGPRADGPDSWNVAAGRYNVPLLSDISDASDDDTTDVKEVQQTVPVDLSSDRGDPCTVCSLCYVESSADVYRSIICPNAPNPCTVATTAKINFDTS